MPKWMAFLLWLSSIIISPLTTVGQTALSTNSGINGNDTYFTADMTVQDNVSITLPNAIFNPVTQTNSTVFTPNSSAQTFHVEAGYDANGGLVMNLWPTNSQSVSSIRLAGGQITAFDTTGNPIGTPSTASVTINGAERSVNKRISPCQPGSDQWEDGCRYTIYDSGSVSVIVNGYTFTVYYDQGSTASTIAAALSAALNYPLSPVSATVSGATITLRSTVNGAATNFPLSVSYTFDTGDFSSPSFVPVPSGGQLTGGTD